MISLDDIAMSKPYRRGPVAADMAETALIQYHIPNMKTSHSIWCHEDSIAQGMARESVPSAKPGVSARARRNDVVSVGPPAVETDETPEGSPTTQHLLPFCWRFPSV